MKKFIIYSIIILFGVLALIGWQQANSLSAKLQADDMVINGLIKSLKQQQNGYDALLDSKYTLLLDYNDLTEQYATLSIAYTKSKLNPVIREVPVYLDRIVEREIIKIPRQFESVEEAQTWLDKNNLSIVLIADENGVIDFVNIKIDNRYNCNEYAQALQEKALKDGFLITYAPVLNGRIFGIYVTDAPNGHMGLLTRIKDSYYYIESTPAYPNSFKLIHIADADRR